MGRLKKLSNKIISIQPQKRSKNIGLYIRNNPVTIKMIIHSVIIYILLILHWNYLSSTSEAFKKHFEKASKKYIKDFNLNKNSYIVDIGSNDGIGLRPFKKLGFKNLLGIEPAKNLAKLSNKNKIKQDIKPIVKSGKEILKILIPDDIKAVISLFFWRSPNVKIVEINIDIGRATLKIDGSVKR